MNPPPFISIEELRIDIVESFPVQVSATVSGALLNGCVTLNGITSSRQGSLFTLNVDATQNIDATPFGADVCTTVMIPFEEEVPLDISRLAVGTYTVMASEIRRDFSLDVDHQACTLPPPPHALEDTRWQLTRGQIGDAAFAPVGGHGVTLDVIDHQVSGHAGCSGYTGLYASSGNRLTIRLDGVTLAVCAPDVTEIETRFLALLETAVTYAYSGDKLVISSPQGALYFTISAVAAGIQ